MAADGAAIDSVRVTVSNKAYDINNYGVKRLSTDSGGRFSFDDALKVQGKRTYSIVPFKEGFSFTPDSAFVELSWIVWEKEAETTAMPGFISYDFRDKTNPEFFPLKTDAFWVYLRQINNVDASEHTVSISGRTNHDGAKYYQMSGKTA